jgi:hypothetical protein
MFRKFQAYKISEDWWVTIEPIHGFKPLRIKYKWTLRTLLFIDRNGNAIPCRDAIASGYASSRRQCRGEAYRAALDASS